jgi:hypothetical protein
VVAFAGRPDVLRAEIYWVDGKGEHHIDANRDH